MQELAEKLLVIGKGKKYGQIIFLTGGAGSGKGFSVKNFLEGEKFKVRDVDEMKKMGFGITSMTICKVNWWFSPSYIVIFEKNKPSFVNVIRDRYLCDICNQRCKRGLTYKGKKYGMNECSNVK